MFHLEYTKIRCKNYKKTNLGLTSSNINYNETTNPTKQVSNFLTQQLKLF